MNLSSIEQKIISDNFYREIKVAARGQKSSLAFIRHKLAKTQNLQPGEKMQVLKIGGSIMQNALVSFNGDKLVIEEMEELRLPIFATKKSFLAWIKANLRKHIRFLALNFAYPVKPHIAGNLLDGVLISGTKEHAFEGLVGKRVGKEIEDFIWSKFRRKIRVAVANDTICLALSGLVVHLWKGLAGGVVGTGLNFGLFLGKDELVNLESGNFNNFPESAETKLIDKRSLTPNRYLFEKQVAGAYLFKHYNLLVKGKHSPIRSTHGLDKVARGELKGDQKLARKLLARSAQMIGCQAAGIARYLKTDMTFVMEGSLFWKAYLYKNIVAKTLNQNTANKYKAKFIAIDNCGIFGAAQLI